ncbi:MULTISPECIES: sulfite exporter TauE/SafE family protein [unclassified Pseudonocardia]|uniref:sulfite exporter TauE/SafE family protein n=1 Tax=unclassified Pseudonocardia TaxID=2619320 RepID=UPI0001FFE5B7|nr:MULTISPECIES: sulfite exporter TauE/SafE family protein [unclassified Pseudonocardia]ALE76266.1 membrane protein [Pseudonocardia sp. EC080625-04]ALL78857.1 membrane protein [Pseudonocardia sp. EC080610-09]ALL85065.1 membrane protein [Pseudonocardia sp. EC080619-01]OLM18804.1 putative membrane protein [Pseudonocardia sp. Ae707_Ps1]
MEWWEVAVIALAGLWAGLINTVVGSGTLVTFPVLVALGFPPVTATTSNAVGLITGSITGAVGYRAELAGHGRRLARYAVASLLGAIVGAALLLTLPPDAFESIVPVLVGLSVVLVAVQPLIARRLRNRERPDRTSSPLVYLAVFLIGIYGGYFTAAQGIMLVGVLGLLVADPLQRLNAFKNALSSVVNLVAGIIYAVVAPVDWAVIGIIAASSIVGGLLGARIGRRLPPTVLRGIIVVIGVTAIVFLLLE